MPLPAAAAGLYARALVGSEPCQVISIPHGHQPLSRLRLTSSSATSCLPRLVSVLSRLRLLRATVEQPCSALQTLLLLKLCLIGTRINPKAVDCIITTSLLFSLLHMQVETRNNGTKQVTSNTLATVHMKEFTDKYSLSTLCSCDHLVQVGIIENPLLHPLKSNPTESLGGRRSY